MHAHGEPFRNVRAEQLRRLEMCERGLALALRHAALRLGDREAKELRVLAVEGERLAEELRQRLSALGGTADPATDESWLVGSLADAEQRALATYHDHLGDHDADTTALFHERLIPHHRAALALLSPALRESEL
jgi:hypothetical protein